MSSCYSTANLISESTHSPSKFSADKINGFYRNQIDLNGRKGLWNILADNKTFKGDTTKVLVNSVVKLELLSDTELKVSLIENDTLKKSLQFKGKVVEDYFSIDKKMLLIPIPALLLHRERKTIIGNTKEGDLILTRGFKNGAWILFMAGDYGGISSRVFQRIKN